MDITLASMMGQQLDKQYPICICTSFPDTKATKKTLEAV
jgi:hypothetical protein